MSIFKGGIAAIALTLAATPALAQPMNDGMHRGAMMDQRGGMSRMDQRMMMRCHRMSHRAMMRDRNCQRLMRMERMGDHGRMDDHRGMGDHRK
jgi:hypothetical protein